MSEKVLVLLSSGGEAMRRSVRAYIDAARGRYELRILAPDAEAKAFRDLGIPIESWKPAGLFNVLRSIGALRRAVERDNPAIVHCFGWTAAAVAMGALPSRFASRAVVSLQDPIRDNEMPKAFVDKRLPELMTRAGAILCAYAGIKRALVNGFHVEADRVTVLGYPVVSNTPRDLARPPGRRGPIVGWSGPLIADRSWEVAIDAVSQLIPDMPEIDLWIAGDGPVKSLVKAHARERGAQHAVTFFGPMPTPELISGIDMLLVPQSRDGLPYQLIEGLVGGVPIVASNTGGIADTLIDRQTAWLVPNDAAGFADGIRDVWSRIDDAWLDAQAQRVAAITEFDPDRIHGEMFAIYDRLIAQTAAVAVD